MRDGLKADFVHEAYVWNLQLIADDAQYSMQYKTCSADTIGTRSLSILKIFVEVMKKADVSAMEV